MKKILVIDDDQMILEILKRWLEDELEADVSVACEFNHAKCLIEKHDWDAVIIDVHLADGFGLDLVDCLRKHQKECNVLMISAQATTQISLEALNLKVDGFIQKPFEKNHLLKAITKLFDQQNGLRVLAIGAHPDDVEIGCGGTLMKHSHHGDRVHILTLSKGEHGGDSKQRHHESHLASSLMNAELTLADLEDTCISEGRETINVISEAIRNFQPDLIYTHTPNDAHQDHRNVFKATMIAARGVPSLACYQSPSTDINFKPSRFSDISGFMELKQQLVNCFGSQTIKCPYLKPSLIKATAEYWGRFSGYGLIEPFEVIRSI